MKNNVHNQSKSLIKATDLDRNFAVAVGRRSGVSFLRCLHCRSCSGGCPFNQAMDYAPHEVIRLVQLGLRREALECSSIWICVGCHTCTIQCPMAIDISAFMDSVSQIALEEEAVVAEPDIFNLHKEVLHSIERYGRAHKLEIMLRYKVKKRAWLEDLDVGLKMLAKRKLDLRPSKVKNIGEITKLFI